MKNRVFISVLSMGWVLMQSGCAQTVPENQWVNSNDNAQIVGGIQVAANEDIARSTVAIYFDLKVEEKTMNICTGTLIASRIVLTAAHCFVDFSDFTGISIDEAVKRSQVGFGIEVVDTFGDSRVAFKKIDRVFVHPFYVKGSVKNALRTPMYDVALIHLNEEAPEGFAPVAIATNKEVLSSGRELVAAGYGRLSGMSSVQAVQLMKVTLKIDNPALTAAQFTYQVQNSKSTCNGDSGGPAYMQNSNGELFVVGVTSWGDRTCSQVGAFTSVPSVAEWIKKQSL